MIWDRHEPSTPQNIRRINPRPRSDGVVKLGECKLSVCVIRRGMIMGSSLRIVVIQSLS